MTNLDRKRVAIAGLGAITPIGNTLSEYWDGLLAGKNGISPIALFAQKNRGGNSGSGCSITIPLHADRV